MKNEWMLVDNLQKRETAQRDIQDARQIGLDTEYDSFRYFREKLCLIQVSTASQMYVFDPLLDLDISFLGEVFADPTTVKVLHACDNDIRLLNRDYDFEFTNIFDTYRAACTLEVPSLSLKAIIQDHLGVELEKSKKIQRSRWDVRPLTEEQLDYAALDTRYLIDLYFSLRERLRRTGLEEVAGELFDKMTDVKWHEKTFKPKGFFTIEGYDDLEENQKLCLKKLYRWRFETAKRTNTAPFLILSDRSMIALSKADDLTVESLSETGILPVSKKETFGAEILKMIEAVQSDMRN